MRSPPASSTPLTSQTIHTHTDAPASSKEPAEELYCWTPDFEHVVDVWNELWDMIDTGDPAARVELERFQQKRLDLVQWIDRVSVEPCTRTSCADTGPQDRT